MSPTRASGRCLPIQDDCSRSTSNDGRAQRTSLFRKSLKAGRTSASSSSTQTNSSFPFAIAASMPRKLAICVSSPGSQGRKLSRAIGRASNCLASPAISCGSRARQSVASKNEKGIPRESSSALDSGPPVGGSHQTEDHHRNECRRLRQFTPSWLSAPCPWPVLDETGPPGGRQSRPHYSDGRWCTMRTFGQHLIALAKPVLALSYRSFEPIR